MKIVAKTYAIQQTANLKQPVNVWGTSGVQFTSTEGGDFRISIYAEASGGTSGSGSVAITLNSDPTPRGSNNFDLTLPLTGGSQTSISGETVVHCGQGAQFVLQSSVSSLPSGSSYDVYVVIEELGAPEV